MSWIKVADVNKCAEGAVQEQVMQFASTSGRVVEMVQVKNVTFIIML